MMIFKKYYNVIHSSDFILEMENSHILSGVSVMPSSGAQIQIFYQNKSCFFFLFFNYIYTHPHKHEADLCHSLMVLPGHLSKCDIFISMKNLYCKSTLSASSVSDQTTASKRVSAGNGKGKKKNFKSLIVELRESESCLSQMASALMFHS